MFDHERASLSLEGTVGSQHSGVIRERREVGEEQRVDHGGKGEALEEGEGEMGQGVNREVRPDSGGGAGCLPVKRHDVRGQPGAEGPVGVRGSRPEERGEGPTEAGRCRVNGGRGADEAESRHSPFVRKKDMEGRKARLCRGNGEGGSPEAVGNPPLDLPPMNIHLGEEPISGDEEVGAI